MQAHTESRPYRTLIARLEERAHVAEEDLFDERMARVIRQIVGEIHASRQQELLETVTVKEAAELTGYSESTIWRHLEQGKLQNVGAEKTTLLRVRDLPFKSGPESFRPAVLRRTHEPPVHSTADSSGTGRAKLTLLQTEA